MSTAMGTAMYTIKSSMMTKKNRRIWSSGGTKRSPAAYLQRDSETREYTTADYRSSHNLAPLGFDGDDPFCYPPVLFPTSESPLRSSAGRLREIGMRCVQIVGATVPLESNTRTSKQPWYWNIFSMVPIRNCQHRLSFVVMLRFKNLTHITRYKWHKRHLHI